MNQESRIKERLKTIIRNSLFMIPSRGFTLIELVIVTAVIGIISAIGTAGLVDYTRTAKLNAAANELVTTLHVAKSNALSQVKDPTLCTSLQPLEGYKVVFNTCTTYDLYVRCGGADLQVGNTKILPDNMMFSGLIPAPVFFSILKGGVVGSGTIITAGYGKTRCITVSPQGVISQPSVCPAPMPC